MEVHMKAIQDNINFCDSLKKENGELVDELDLKEEEIKDYIKQVKALQIQLAHKSNEVSGLHTNLSQDINGLTSKLLNRDNRIKELETQINQTKIGHLDDLQNKLHKANEEIKHYIECCENLNTELHEVQGIKKTCSVSDASTQSDERSPPASPTPKKVWRAEGIRYNDQQLEEHFKLFINQYYSWNKNPSISKKASMSFKHIYEKLQEISGTNTSKPLYTLKRDYRHWPDQKVMIDILREKTEAKYNHWDCPLKSQGHNGSYDKFGNHLFDLKLRI